MTNKDWSYTRARGKSDTSKIIAVAIVGILIATMLYFSYGLESDTETGAYTTISYDAYPLVENDFADQFNPDISDGVRLVYNQGDTQNIHMYNINTSVSSVISGVGEYDEWKPKISGNWIGWTQKPPTRFYYYYNLISFNTHEVEAESGGVAYSPIECALYGNYYYYISLKDIWAEDMINGTRQLVDTFAQSLPEQVHIDIGGHYLVYTGKDSQPDLFTKIHILDLTGNASEIVIDINAIDISITDDVLAYVTSDGAVFTYDISTGITTEIQEVGSGVTQVAIYGDWLVYNGVDGLTAYNSIADLYQIIDDSDYVADDGLVMFERFAYYTVENDAGYTDIWACELNLNPDVVHEPVLYEQVGNSILITASIRDDYGVSSVGLYYKPVNEASYSKIDMYLSSGTTYDGEWSETIPAQIEGGYLYYYIQAVDNDSNITQTSEYEVQIRNVDTTPPTISHTPLAYYLNTNVSINITAVVTDNYQIDEVYLLYNGTDGISYQNISMTRISGGWTEGVFTSQIPAQNDSGIVRYYIGANDIYGNYNESARYMISIDNATPLITHSRVIEYEVDEPIPISALVSDDVAVSNVVLHYKEVDSDEYTTTNMNLYTGNNISGSWRDSIPAQSEEGEVVYYITATDVVNNTVSTDVFIIDIYQPEVPPDDPQIDTPLGSYTMVIAVVTIVSMLGLAYYYTYQKKKR